MSALAWPKGLLEAWHPIAYLKALRDRPLAATLLDRPLIVFRSTDGIAVLEDRCPHRNAPLSRGRVVGGTVECPYHGWRFGRDGACLHVAGADRPADARAHAFPVIVRDGLIWTSLSPLQPAPPSPLPDVAHDPNYDSFWWPLPASRGGIADAIENLLDPIHSYFLHPGLVRRSRTPQPVTIDFTVGHDQAAARYVEPTTGMTWLQRLTEGERVASWGRYWPPTMVQIAFEDRHGIHASIVVVFAPVGAERTRPYARFSTRRGMAPPWLKRLFITTFHRRVLDQDLAMLAAQADNRAAFGGVAYHDGPLDLFGSIVWNGINGRALTLESRTLILAASA